MKFEAIVEHLKAKGFDLEQIENSTPKGVLVDSDRIQLLAELLHRDPDLYFDMLSCVTGIDNGPEANTMEVVYTFYSIPMEHHLQVKVVLERGLPKVDTLSTLYKSADWYEREIFDLLGIEFIGHPDLRRILLPADWEGHPLRKDYEHQDYYRGIKVEY